MLCPFFLQNKTISSALNPSHWVIVFLKQPKTKAPKVCAENNCTYFWHIQKEALGFFMMLNSKSISPFFIFTGMCQHFVQRSTDQREWVQLNQGMETWKFDKWLSVYDFSNGPLGLLFVLIIVVWVSCSRGKL